MDIPGIKSLNILAQRPIALLPEGGMDLTSAWAFFIEVTFESDAVLTVPISRNIYTVFMERLKEQGIPVVSRVSARPQVAKEGIAESAPKESFLPVDRAVGLREVESALREAVEGEEAPPSTITVPATPMAIEAAKEDADPPTPRRVP